MVKILIAPWGLYENWKTAEYIMYTGDDVQTDITEISTTPLKLLKKYIKPDKIIIVTLDTIYCSSRYNGERGHRTYSEILDAIKTHTMEYIDKNVGHNAVNNVFVGPGVGEFDNGSAIGQMMDFYYTALHSLVNEITKLDFTKKQKIEFYLDLTHGVNFMPTLMYRIIHEIARITALTNDVKVTIFNSEPFPYHLLREKNGETIPKLRVHKLEERKITKTMALEMVSESGLITKNKYFTFAKFVKNDEKGYLNKEAKEVSEKYSIMPSDINVFLRGIKFALPLVIYSFYPSVESIGKFRDWLYKLYQNNTEIEYKNDVPHMRHKVLFVDNFGILQHTYLISKALNLTKKEESTLEEIIYLRDLIFKDQTEEILINREIRELKNGFIKVCCARIELNNIWIPYAKISSFEDTQKESSTKVDEKDDVKRCIERNKRNPSYENRNFLAHKGLSMSHLEVKYIVTPTKDDITRECGKQVNENNRIILRYSPNKISAIKSFVLNK